MEQHDKGRAAPPQKGAQRSLKLLLHRQGPPSSCPGSSSGGEARGGFWRSSETLLSSHLKVDEKSFKGAPQRARLEPCRAGEPKNWCFCLKGAKVKVGAPHMVSSTVGEGVASLLLTQRRHGLGPNYRLHRGAGLRVFQGAFA